MFSIADKWAIEKIFCIFSDYSKQASIHEQYSNQLNCIVGAGSGIVNGEADKNRCECRHMYDICVLYMVHWIIFNTCHIDRCDNSWLWAKIRDCNQHKKRPSTWKSQWNRCQFISHSTCYRLNAGQKVLWYIHSRSIHAHSLYISFHLSEKWICLTLISSQNAITIAI